jgi:hypothetical protein
VAGRYLVLFVLDPADDRHARELEQLADAARQLHPWEGAEPRSFDVVPDESGERTVGIALRVEELPEADRGAVSALLHGAAAAGERLGVRLEVQLAEQRLGTVAGGRADDAVLDRLEAELGLDLS